MNLKKNDKVILIVGVVILVSAAIGVALYTSPNDDNAGNTEPDLKNYSYEWIRKTGETNLDGDFYADKNEPYSDIINVITPDGSVLTNVEILLNWEDDNTYGLIIKKGYDTLTVGVGKQGSEQQEVSSTGSDNLSFPFSINDMPSAGYEPAEDEEDAIEIIKNRYYMKNTASFNIDVSVDTGERIWRLLNYIKDKGNDFEVKVKYTYYEIDLMEPEDDDDNKPTGDDGGYNTAIGEFYKNLCYGRGMI